MSPFRRGRADRNLNHQHGGVARRLGGLLSESDATNQDGRQPWKQAGNGSQNSGSQNSGSQNSGSQNSGSRNGRGPPTGGPECPTSCQIVSLSAVPFQRAFHLAEWGETRCGLSQNGDASASHRPAILPASLSYLSGLGSTTGYRARSNSVRAAECVAFSYEPEAGLVRHPGGKTLASTALAGEDRGWRQDDEVSAIPAKSSAIGKRPFPCLPHGERVTSNRYAGPPTRAGCDDSELAVGSINVGTPRSWHI